MEIQNVELPMEAIEAFCRKHKIVEFALFGSVLRPDFRKDSDVDVLVTFAEDSERSLLDEAAMELELETILGRPVDLVDKSSIANSKNALRREEVFSTAQTVYVG